MNINEKLQRADGTDKESLKLFRSLVGGLNYLTHTRPDIVFYVSVVSRFLQSPTKQYFGIVKQILRYVARTTNFGIWYSKEPNFILVGFIDSDYAGCLDDRKSTSESCFSFDSRALTWSSKKKETIALSTSEAKYVIEGYGHILPLAYGIVDSENDDSWLWFFENFKNSFGEREDMCFVSDRNKSIWNATAVVYPEFRHYACIYHLWTNLLKKTYRDTEEVRTLFFSLAKAYTVQEFDELMKRMDQINPKYCAYLQKANYEKWSCAHSPVKITWTLTSNIAESLNNAILVGRRLPVVPLLEFVRKTIEAWNEKHNEEGRNTTTTLTSKYNEMLKDNRNLSHRMLVRASTIHLHTITDGAKRFTVSLNTRMCSCGKFQHDEIPCSHALAAIRHRNKHRDDYYSAYYSNKNYQDTYAIPIEPLPCESTWDVPSHDLKEVVSPPITRKQPGRPPKNDRKKGFTEREGKKRKLYS
ncbi:uncharacterized protein LOC125823455 [Solanum verrucosum]|uniref:uncharacterized protein LOC125823455 n=1 Tax=Solanum verrucosum TaxID=315347 RepID=UPI0020D147C2|nr:uncharacterized protein LOC125823455 [Solanum verrucosum]